MSRASAETPSAWERAASVRGTGQRWSSAIASNSDSSAAVKSTTGGGAMRRRSWSSAANAPAPMLPLVCALAASRSETAARNASVLPGRAICPVSTPSVISTAFGGQNNGGWECWRTVHGESPVTASRSFTRESWAALISAANDSASGASWARRTRRRSALSDAVSCPATILLGVTFPT